MKVEGYKLNPCGCVYEYNECVDFVESMAYNEPRFMLVCRNCGHATSACQTKEQAVHKWNSDKNLLLG